MLEPDGGGAPVTRAPADTRRRTRAARHHADLDAPRPLYAISRVHLTVMTDHVGIWQHARGAQPDPRFGYCTDDVARLLVVDELQYRHGLGAAVEGSIRLSLDFLENAFDHVSCRFLNLRRSDGDWLDDEASEDCHARALIGLAAVMNEMPGTEPADRARRLFVQALPASTSFGALRSIAATILACDTACEAGLTAEGLPTLALLADLLSKAFDECAAVLDWPWPEPVLTYENALIPHALIVAGMRLGRPESVARGRTVLDWLIDVQAGETGCFSPIGNSQWWPRTGERSQFDQQPIEAATMVAAAAAAYGATSDRRYLAAAEAAYGWFLGDNDLGLAVADPARGACHDGLTPRGVNLNQGAESTLMWLTALERMRELRSPVHVDSPHLGEDQSGRTMGVRS